MHKRRFGFFGILLSLVFVLAACTASGTTTSGQNAQASPSASPVTVNGQNVQSTNLATAMRNLEDLNSYVLTMNVQNAQGSVAIFSGSLPNYTMKVTRHGSNRHIEVINPSGNDVFQAWIVDGNMYVSFGSGNPMELSNNNALVKQVNDAVTMEQMYFYNLQSKDANYQVIGTDTVNNQQVKVETATYQLNTQANNSLFSGMMNGNVQSKIWVEMTNNYLMKADFVMTANANASRTGSLPSSVSGTTVNGTPVSQYVPNQLSNVTGNAEIVATVSQVNNVPQITAPGS